MGKHPSANPTLHGFDEFRGLTCGCGDYFSKIDRNGYEDWWHNIKLDFQEGYTTNVITNNAINFIKSNTQEPFFLYVAHLAVHFPWQSPEDGNLDIRKKDGDFTSNFPGPQSKLGPHLPEDVPLVLIKMIEELDNEVGRIINTLRDEGLDQNTLVFFTSDNGGYLNYNGTTWPNVGSNGILRGQKTQAYEGGHRVPAIAWWPGQIAPLSVCDETVLSFDILPTVLDITEISLPKKESPNAIDGVSLVPILFENTKIQSRTLFWRTGKNEKAVRNGNWKLVFNNEQNVYELYNLKIDIGETRDLAFRYPEIVQQLKLELLAWENDVDRK